MDLDQQEHIKPFYYQYGDGWIVPVKNTCLTHWVYKNFNVAPVAAFRSIRENRIIAKGRMKGYRFYRVRPYV